MSVRYCHVCTAEAHDVCGACEQVDYCSEECRDLDFSEHAPYCEAKQELTKLIEGSSVVPAIIHHHRSMNRPKPTTTSTTTSGGSDFEEYAAWAAKSPYAKTGQLGRLAQRHFLPRLLTFFKVLTAFLRYLKRRSSFSKRLLQKAYKALQKDREAPTVEQLEATFALYEERVVRILPLPPKSHFVYLADMSFQLADVLANYVQYEQKLPEAIIKPLITALVRHFKVYIADLKAYEMDFYRIPEEYTNSWYAFVEALRKFDEYLSPKDDDFERQLLQNLLVFFTDFMLWVWQDQKYTAYPAAMLSRWNIPLQDYTQKEETKM